MKRLVALALGCAMLLGGCVVYRPIPVPVYSPPRAGVVVSGPIVNTPPPGAVIVGPNNVVQPPGGVRIPLPPQ